MNFIEKSSNVIKNLYKEIKTFSDMNGFDFDYVEYSDCIELQVSYDSLLILSFVNEFNELEMMFQMLSAIYYLNSSSFKNEFLDIINYREKIITTSYYKVTKVVGLNIIYDELSKEWIDKTLRIKIIINKPNNEKYITLDYPILLSLINLYILP
jgi:uncharacterized membrane protein